MKKKIMTFTLAAAFILSAAGVHAGSREPFIKLERAGEQGLHLYMDSLTDLAKLTIYDRNRVVLFSDNIDQRYDFRRKFDLSKLPAGSYSFEIEYGNKIKAYSFSIENGMVNVNPSYEAVYKPTIIRENRLLDISLLNLNGNEVSVDLYDAFGKKLVNQKFDNAQTIAKRYDLSQLPSGNYQLVIRTSDRVYNEVVNL